MTTPQGPARARFSIKRSYEASLEQIWALWTTGPGIESWWGPEGFKVVVTSLDLRPGGELVYQMIADAPEQIAFMEQAGMPLATECTVTYTEITPPTRLAYKTLTDFVPGVEPYEVQTIVTLSAAGSRVDVSIEFDAMHDDIWTERARAGHEGQLRKLDRLLGQGIR